MSFRRVAFVSGLLLIACTGVLPFAYSSMHYIAEKRWADAYDGKTACQLSSDARADNRASGLCEVRQIQIVGRTPALYDATFSGTYSLSVVDGGGRTYSADLVPTGVAERSWMQSGSPAPTTALFFDDEPVLINLAGETIATQRNPDFRKSAAWLQSLLYAGISLIEIALASAVWLLAPPDIHPGTPAATARPIAVQQRASAR